ncbi:bifunctional demethylmenaquinone methyltransferase/2-methoxy-6-polyprenyl-1,4-benzoquinol methylase UbiE [Chlamydia abortus]|uniref:Demethylmenaquinone methyltransferase n=1 Tax=Chlamydia abortus (strain DSM 27085 / S26/3) TaxID=218497 RepID=Q5L6P0_CHLAB|nr:bifunctional demethylmenaquinone methyltransferase/2-methoxy-6-polyprenyl-1,4-benzoquinol methylase UbiE [Chlamydia abortus]ASD30409.1 bifunctional demethylmenaquinone methyltransferase/2-methoxy-6-polyprenyl-1,4-benzoquinol methylase [Chlamydia abortus]AUS59664.1 demethylmenaquinone methyltransferase/2-methoxy-6-polyprenyl-1,4-benzoquinol methylase UbiE [Chlamydia abortus]QRR31935.1 bifunctional demethylmenaquinone methyltransferase/2-methoxy-6-polyprenyl-1,4-benzoquinol methylase UbiE [Chla
MLPSTHKPNLQEMFDSLALKYDKINSILSFGMHHVWNRTFSKMLGKSDHLIDLCSGTGKVAYRYIRDYPGATATLVDFSANMLHIAKQRYPTAPFTFIEGDIAQLPIREESQTLVSMAYGLRNLPTPKDTLENIHRILKHQGTLGILELTSPPHNHPLYQLHRLYLKFIIPWIGKLYSKNRQAYAYLAESIRQLPSDHYLEQLFSSAKFQVRKKRKLAFGAATIWILKKI